MQYIYCGMLHSNAINANVCKCTISSVLRTCLCFGYSALCLTQVVLITNALPLTTGSLLFQLLQKRYKARCTHLQDGQFQSARSDIEQYANES
jgi:hypothetical protein